MSKDPNDPAARVAALRKQLQQLEMRGETEEMCKVLVELGLALADAGEFNEAIAELERILPLTETLEDPGTKASLLGMLGVIHSRAGRPQESSEKFIVALKAMEDSAPNVEEQFQCLMGIGRNLVALGDLRSGIVQYTEAENLARKYVLPQEELDAIASKIVLHEQRGEYKDVLPLYKRAITLFRLIGDAAGGVAMLKGLANVYGKLGKREQSKRCIELWAKAKADLGDNSPAEGKEPPKTDED
jgi:tetratricopeptide (TPR) repeat protein